MTTTLDENRIRIDKILFVQISNILSLQYVMKKINVINASPKALAAAELEVTLLTSFSLEGFAMIIQCYFIIVLMQFLSVLYDEYFTYSLTCLRLLFFHADYYLPFFSCDFFFILLFSVQIAVDHQAPQHCCISRGFSNIRFPLHRHVILRRRRSSHQVSQNDEISVVIMWSMMQWQWWLCKLFMTGWTGIVVVTCEACWWNPGHDYAIPGWSSRKECFSVKRLLWIGWFKWHWRYNTCMRETFCTAT